MGEPFYVPHWSDPLPVVITDDEKNEAVNRMERNLARWSAREDEKAKQPEQPPNEPEET